MFVVLVLVHTRHELLKSEMLLTPDPIPIPIPTRYAYEIPAGTG